jgi:hypothetical protein
LLKAYVNNFDQLSHSDEEMHHWTVTRQLNKFNVDCAYVTLLPVWADGLNVVVLRAAVTKGSRSFCV